MGLVIFFLTLVNRQDHKPLVLFSIFVQNFDKLSNLVVAWTKLSVIIFVGIQFLDP